LSVSYLVCAGSGKTHTMMGQLSDAELSGLCSGAITVGELLGTRTDAGAAGAPASGPGSASGASGSSIAGASASAGGVGAAGGGGAAAAPSIAERAGLAPRLLASIFAAIQAEPPGFSFSLQASFLEIYNERIRDLLVGIEEALRVRGSEGSVSRHGRLLFAGAGAGSLAGRVDASAVDTSTASLDAADGAGAGGAEGDASEAGAVAGGDDDDGGADADEAPAEDGDDVSSLGDGSSIMSELLETPFTGGLSGRDGAGAGRRRAGRDAGKSNSRLSSVTFSDRFSIGGASIASGGTSGSGLGFGGAASRAGGRLSLGPGAPGFGVGEEGGVEVRMNRDGKGVHVEGAREVTVGDIADIFEVLQVGARQRAVAATAMNDTSSRSHSVFTLKVRRAGRWAAARGACISPLPRWMRETLSCDCICNLRAGYC
jgi:hypothetical protein